MPVTRLAGVLLAAACFAFCWVAPILAQTGPDSSVAIGNLLFQDDFATFSGRWRMGSSPKGRLEIIDQALRFRVESPGYRVWSVPDIALPLRDYSVQVSVSVSDQTAADSRFGIVLEYVDDEHFYAMLLDTQDTWWLIQRDGNAWHELGGATPTGIKLLDNMSTRDVLELEVHLVGESLTLLINGEIRGTFSFTRPVVSGAFGLMVVAGHGVIDMSFDDVLVTDIRPAE